ncbi:uncharacterized protein M421DRAFT_110348 [Didymella exigua CBS 183.55]|uniref:Uncharacterized protein n=1 Tax=Didymella exigua CBS 183.55 TaxID=1150837 RepID=A0A6A5S3T9_9PLEO|nr:uncharacterized protein M421DRAFT_110348 [Didymella exigua CBS 183.55]KAF1934008.1 hypothetical protein M421DRAFT_110348 [Didymella exigua CBS 183.55]
MIYYLVPLLRCRDDYISRATPLELHGRLIAPRLDSVPVLQVSVTEYPHGTRTMHACTEIGWMVQGASRMLVGPRECGGEVAYHYTLSWWCTVSRRVAAQTLHLHQHCTGKRLYQYCWPSRRTWGLGTWSRLTRPYRKSWPVENGTTFSSKGGLHCI